MLTAALTVDLSRFERFVAAFDAALSRTLATTSPVRDGVEEAVALYAAETQKRFNRASGGDGTWRPLKPATIARKRRQTLFPDRILYLTGALFNSLTPGGPGSIYDVLEDRVRYGTADPKARYHQPTRPILVPPTAGQLTACAAPIVAGWRDTIHALCRAA